MADKVTITTIAEYCEVSPTTVSLVLNHKPGVSDETRSRVFAAANALGYKGVSANGRKTEPKGLATIGMIVKTDPEELPPSNPFYSQIIAGVDDACNDLGINLLFSMLPVDEDNHPIKIPHLVNDPGLTGLLMVGTFIDETILSLGKRPLPPIVFVDGYSDRNSYDMVVSDNYGAAYQAVEYLIQIGHEHIALVGGEQECYPSIQLRRNGYFQALKDRGLAHSYTADFNIAHNQGEEAITKLLDDHPEISAVFAVNDRVAIDVIRAAQRLGRRVPEDLSVAGYDDIYLATSTNPTLTTMNVDTLAMGRAAVHLLSLRVEKPDAARSTLIIHPTLVLRESTRPAQST